LDLARSVLAAVLAGAALSGAGSLVLGGRSAEAAVAGLESQAGGPVQRPRHLATSLPPAIVSSAPPLFPVLSGPHAAPEVSLRLDGVARTPGRAAALLSINGASATWLQLGEDQEGVTLLAVGGASATVDTARGQKLIKLGDGPSPGSGETAAEPAAAADGAPASWRGREPASAPGVGR
jgi:hypothetical protein